MSLEVESQPVAVTTPVKETQVLSSQLALSPASPLINGYRQATLAFKKEEKKSDNENVEPAEKAEVKPAPKMRGRPKKQSLLAEQKQGDEVGQNMPPPQPPKKPQRARLV